MNVIYKNTRISILDDRTAVARLSDIFTVMDKETFSQSKSAELVGGIGRLFHLIEQGKIRAEKPTKKQNGKWFCNAADVLLYVVIKHKKKK